MPATMVPNEQLTLARTGLPAAAAARRNSLLDSPVVPRLAALSCRALLPLLPPLPAPPHSPAVPQNRSRPRARAQSECPRQTPPAPHFVAAENCFQQPQPSLAMLCMLALLLTTAAACQRCAAWRGRHRQPCARMGCIPAPPAPASPCQGSLAARPPPQLLQHNAAAAAVQQLPLQPCTSRRNAPHESRGQSPSAPPLYTSCPARPTEARPPA